MLSIIGSSATLLLLSCVVNEEVLPKVVEPSANSRNPTADSRIINKDTGISECFLILSRLNSFDRFIFDILACYFCLARESAR